MIHSKEVKKGTIIEIIAHNDMAFFGSVSAPETIIDKNRLRIGEQYECLSDVKKRGTSLRVSLQQVNGKKHGDIFWVFIQPIIRIISTPTPTEPVERFSEEALKLNDNEEFVFVKKTQPNLVFRGMKDWFYDVTNKADKADVVDGVFVFNPKSGTRKRIKSLATLYGVLNTNTGMTLINYYEPYLSSNSPISRKEQEYHLHKLNNIPDWVNWANLFKTHDDMDVFIHAASELELRKYNMDTRQISEQAVHFDIMNYLQRFQRKMHWTRMYGEAVSDILQNMHDNHEVDDYPYIVSIKEKFEQYQNLAFVPHEKDSVFHEIYKGLKLKKKENPYYNANGFVAVAFQTEQQKNDFLNQYQNHEKHISVIHTAELYPMPSYHNKTNKPK